MRTANTVLYKTITSEETIARELFVRLSSSRDAMVICESVNDDPPGTILLRKGIRVLLSEGHVYPFVTNPRNVAAVTGVIRAAHTIPHELVVMTQLPEDVEHWIAARPILCLSDFEQLAAGFRWGAVGAYDGESYVVWSPG
jgi:hypothetical protein